MNAKFAARVLVGCAGGVGVVGMSLAGCASKPHLRGPDRASAAFAAAEPWSYAGRPITEPVGMPAAPSDAGPRLISESVLTFEQGSPYGEGVAPAPVVKQPGELLRVKYAANNAPAPEVLGVLIGQLMKRPYIVDSKVANTVSLDIDEEMTRAELMDFIGALASIYDWSFEDRDGILVVRPAASRTKAVTAPLLTGAAINETEMPAVRVRKLRYASPADITAVLKELMSEGAKQFAVGRMIVLADTVRQVNRMSRLISAMDTNALEGTCVWTYRLSSRPPEDAAQILDKIITGSRASPAGGEQLATFVPVPGTDRLIVLSRDQSLRPLVRTFVEQVDQPPDRGHRHRYLYRVQNMDPTQLLGFLANMLPDRVETGSSGAPGAGGASVASTKKPIRIVLEQTERLLFIEAVPADFAEVVSLIKAVDRPKMQVLINSTIAEVALTGSLEFGVQYFFQGNNVEKLGIFGLTGNPGLPVGGPTGSIFFTASDGLALVQALQREAKVEILSQPRVFVRDGVKATISVGGQTPVAKSSSETPAQNQGSTLSRTDIDYKDTGVKLEIEPKLNESGLVSLKITQDNRVITAPDTSTQAGQISPAFQTRTVTTDVTVPSGRTVVLGGIIDTRHEKRVAKVPILGSLPLIGEAFTATFDKTDRTELLLTITPTIVPEPTEMVAQMSAFLSAAENVRAVFIEHANDLPRGMLHDPEYGLGEPSVPREQTIPEGVAPEPPVSPEPPTPQ